MTLDELKDKMLKVANKYEWNRSSYFWVSFYSDGSAQFIYESWKKKPKQYIVAYAFGPDHISRLLDYMLNPRGEPMSGIEEGFWEARNEANLS